MTNYRASTCGSSEIVAMAPSRVVVSSPQLARSRPRSLSTSRRANVGATIDDDDAVADVQKDTRPADKSIISVFTATSTPRRFRATKNARVVRSPRELAVIDDEERETDGGDGGAATRAARRLALGVLDSSESRSRFRCFCDRIRRIREDRGVKHRAGGSGTPTGVRETGRR